MTADSGTPVFTLPAAPLGGTGGIGSTKSTSGLSPSSTCCSSAAYFAVSAVTCSCVMPPRSRSLFAKISRTVGCDAIFWYISGCVNAGSSPSLCP